MSVIEKLKKNTTIPQSSILSKSKLFNDKDVVPTPVPMINVALSGDLEGGLTPGITEIAGPSKYFKSNFGLLLAMSYLEKYEDAAVLFYDSEFGTPKSYIESFGVDQDRVFHSPITDVEIMKIDIMKQLKEINKGERVLVLLDSLGQLASRKEVEDAEEGVVKSDMSRAKAIKSMFRMITPHFRLKDIPMIVINHTYKEIGLYPKDIAGGGTGLYYAADTIWFMGREQEKDSKKELLGYKFNINIEKSRFVKEKSKIPITVTFDGGIEKYSGLLDIALEGKFVVKPKDKQYTRPGIDTPDKKGDIVTYSEAQTYSDDFWSPLLKNDKFKSYVSETYAISSRPIFQMAQQVDSENT